VIIFTSSVNESQMFGNWNSLHKEVDFSSLLRLKRTVDCRSLSIFLVFTARSVVGRGIAKASCPSVRYRDHIGWNSAKIISRLISLTFLLSADHKHDGST